MPDNEIRIGIEVDADPRAFDKLADDARRGANRAGSEIVDEMKRAGARAEAEADAMAKAMSRELSDIPPPRFEDRIVPQAKEAGGKAADGVVGEMMGMDLSGVGGLMSSSLAYLGPIGAGVGALVGEEIAEGLGHGFDSRRNVMLDSVRSGLSGPEIRSIGVDAGEAYGDGFGEGLRELEQAGQLIRNTMAGLDDDLDMDQALRSAQTLSDIWGVEVPESLQIARDLVTSSLAPDTVTAFAQMADAQQRYQLDAADLNGTMEEFSSFMGRLGVEGSTAWRTIGEATRNNVFPTVDRAGEMFEEFSISMQERTSEVRRSLEMIGVDADAMFALFDAGRGAEAMATINRALAETNDTTTQNTAALGIYRMAWEGVVDPQLALEIYSQVDAVGQLGTALEDGTAALEESTTGWQRFKRDITDVASSMGTGISHELQLMYDLLEVRPIDAARTAWRGLGDVFGFGGDEAEDFASNLEDAKEAAREEGAATQYAANANDELNRALADTGPGLDDVADSAGDAAAEIEAMDAAFAQLAGQFEGDQAIRGLYDDLRALKEEGIETKGVTYDLGTGFDQTTEAGGTLAAQLEDLHGGLLEVADAHRNGTATAADLRDAQAGVESQLRAVADQLGLTEAQTQDLIARYGQVPDNVSTDYDLIGDEAALSNLDRLVIRLRGLDGWRATSYIDTVQTTTYRSRVSGGNAYRAAGGPVSGLAGGGTAMSTALVNEGAGQESAWLPDGDLVMLPTGSKVNSAEDTERMVATGQLGGGPTVNNHFTISGSVLAERDIREIVADALRQGGLR